MATIAATAPNGLLGRLEAWARPRIRMLSAAAIVIVWVVLFRVVRGHNTLALAPSDTNSLHRWFNRLQTSIGENRGTNPLFTYFFNPIRSGVDHYATGVQNLIADPVGARPVPYVGWLGVLALLVFAAWVFGNWRVALLTFCGFLFMGLQGLWQESMDTLALTLVAVSISLAIGIPLGVWAGVSNAVNRVITPILDFMQIMPTFVYLSPLALVFLIGPASGVIATLIYAVPPVIRLTSHGVRGVPAETREAVDSLGATRGQALRGALLPMAKRTIVIGINQTIMCALAMVTIAALIDAPGLGQTVFQALTTLDVGSAFNGGLAIVLMAIVLDRVTTAASVRAENARRRSGGRADRMRRPAIAVGAVITAGAVVVSSIYQLVAIFPSRLELGGGHIALNVGKHISSWTASATNWVQQHFSSQTSALKDAITLHVLNPLQTLLDTSPWWLTAAALVGLAYVVGRLRAVIATAICLGLIIATGLWQDSMDTLAAVLVATVIVVALGIAFGVWMGRSRRADAIIRPLLDAAQTMPPFVYLIPFLALFGPTRFTGIVAGVVYAAPVAIKIMADGIRGVSPSTVEAARSAGSNAWQIIRKVQLPMSLRSLVLATNQGLIYVLSMVVVSGLVGGGALGFDVVAGFSQTSLFGKGLAAGFAIVFLGVMLDRTTAAAARRAGRVTS